MLTKTSHVVPSYMKSALTPPTSSKKSSDKPSIVDPFLATVRLFTDQSAPSTIETKSPIEGVGGRVIANTPPEVSAMIASWLDAV